MTEDDKEKLMNKAYEDPTFRSLLLTDPDAAGRQIGVNLSAEDQSALKQAGQQQNPDSDLQPGFIEGLVMSGKTHGKKRT